MLIVALSTAYAAEPIPAHVQERTDRALDAVDASEEQRTGVYELLSELVPKVKALHDEGHALRDELHAVLLTPEIDRTALEDLRVDAVDLFDRGTTLAFGHIADVAELFTVSQRQALIDFHDDMRRRFHGRLAE